MEIELLAVFRVEWSDRVQCQCNGCGQTIYAAIHMIRLPDGELQCWGSDCYRRERGATESRDQPIYSGVNGRPLTTEERAILLTNRDELIARFKAEEEARIAAEKARQMAIEAQRKAWQEQVHQIREAPAPAEDVISRGKLQRSYEITLSR